MATMTMQETMKAASFLKPTETRTFPKGKLELVKIGKDTFGRATFEPGWKWSTSVKPIVKTDSCEAPHINFHIAGRLMIVMDDGTKQEFGPGEISIVPPGHDAWTVGDQAAEIIDISGMEHYAKMM
ncbi:MAG: cupin domain-containing protein [Candidatus Peribacteraceae bacterium]|nr:cupin domain-containing protein [Candidatus Peribacteraceae bacterium]